MRGKGEGSVFKNSKGLWCATIELPTHNGNRRRKSVTAKSKSDVLKKMRALQHQLRVQGDMPTADQTLESWLNHWLNNIASKETRPKTWGNYKSLLNTYVIPAIGQVRLERLSPTHIRRVHQYAAELGRSSTTALTAHRVLSSALTAAVDDQRLDRNVARNVRGPKRAVTQLEVLSLDEVTPLIRSVEDSAFAYMWATFLLTGARRGEVLGLQWDRVTDFIEFSWQLQRFSTGYEFPPGFEYQNLYGGLHLSRPKSRAGIRAIPLVEPLGSILDKWRAIAPENKWGLVFTMPDGKPIDPDYATKAWNDARDAAGITKNVRLHDLRHGAVDLLYEAGVPEAVIVEIVGHSNRVMTRAYRSKANVEQLRKALEPYTALMESGKLSSPTGER